MTAHSDPTTTSAPRPTTPRAAELYLTTGLTLPWPARQNPAHAEHARRARDAAGALGLTATPGDARRFEAFVAADGWAYPTARGERLHAAGGFNQWLYLLDDQYDDDPAFGRDPVAVRRLFERAFGILETGALPPDATPFDRWTREIRARLVSVAHPGWMQRFLVDAHDYLFRGSLTVMELWAAGRVLGVDDYAALRLYDSSLYAVFDVLELAVDAPLGAAQLAHPGLRELRLRAARHVAFANDLFSYHKEVVRHGSQFNLLHVLALEERKPLAEAAAEALALLEADVDRFVAVEAALPRWSPEIDAAVARYVDGLKGWMAGNVAFSSASPRFRAPDAIFADLRG